MNDEILPLDEPLTQDDALTVEEKQQQRRYLKSRGVAIGAPFQLSLWSETKRMQPNDMVRSALWSTRPDKVEREFIKRRELFTPDSTVKIMFTGEELRSNSDELIWMQLVDLYVRCFPIPPLRNDKGIAIDVPTMEVNINQICKDVGWSPSVKYYAIVNQSIERLANCTIKIVSAKHSKAAYMPMIVLHRSNEGFKNNATKFTYSVHPDLAVIIAGKTMSYLEWEPTKKLKPIERRLYGYIVSHAIPAPLEVKTFYKTCKSQNKNMASFRQEIRRALQTLMDKKLLIRGWVAGDEIHFERKA